MGIDQTIDPPDWPWRSQTDVRCARGGKRHHVCAVYRLSVAVYPQRPAATQQSQNSGFPPPRLRPFHVAKTLQSLIKFPDGL